MMCGWSTSILGKARLGKLAAAALFGVVVYFCLFLCSLVSFDSQPTFDWARQVLARL